MSPAEMDEAERVSELYRYADPDEPQGDEVDDIVAAAAEVAGAAMATLNLLDSERQCQVATSGFTGSVSPRREAMCDLTLELGTFVHVPDARNDPRFAHSPWVDGRLGVVRFYASAPLTTQRGYVIGTLCVFDVEPRELSPQQVRQLQQLAARVVDIFSAGAASRC
jgi:GAF domain-containing protein